MNQNIEMARRGAAKKLGPEAINTSSFVRSLLGYLVDEKWTIPYIVHLRAALDAGVQWNDWSEQ